MTQSSTWRLLLALLIGCLFALPHAVRVLELGSYAAYSPFSAHAPSPMVWDETFLYGAEANYSLTRGGAPAYDDTWEHRASVYPYSILPTDIEAALAAVCGGELHGGLKTAHILVALLFTALSAWLLMYLLGRCGASVVWSATLALVLLVVAFSLRSWLLAVRALLLHGHGARAMDTLQAARTPNPAMTFPLLLAAVLCATLMMAEQGRRRTLAWALAGGVLGGLLFASYVYYAVAWSAAVLLLAAASVVLPAVVPRVAWLLVLLDAAAAIPFALWRRASDADGGTARTLRLGMVRGHALTHEGIRLTLAWGAVLLLLAVAGWVLRAMASRSVVEAATTRFASALVLVLLCVGAGGLAGMNMQVLTGFNVQAAHHFPHMLLQPVALLLLLALAAWLLGRVRAVATVDRLGLLVFAALFVGTAGAQFEAARDSAALFRVPDAERELFRWLNVNTPVGSVVASDNLAIDVVLPVRTHNAVLVSNGSRGGASDDEIVERFLLASRLAGRTDAAVAAELRDGGSEHTTVPMATPTYYLFENSATWERGGSDRHIMAARLPSLTAAYRAMNVPVELQRFRVDYLWTTGAEVPAAVNGYTWQRAATSSAGAIWQLVRR